jgi:hypothetical protein
MPVKEELQFLPLNRKSLTRLLQNFSIKMESDLGSLTIELLDFLIFSQIDFVLKLIY